MKGMMTYQPHLDGGILDDGRFNTTTNPFRAMLIAEELKREDPEALVTIVVDIEEVTDGTE